MSEQDTGAAAPNQDPNASQFSLQRIYVRDLSFESPGAPESFRTQWKPKVGLELNTRHQNIEATLYEVVLSMTIIARNEQDENMYLCEVQQAGIFHIANLDDAALEHTLNSFCPALLFPYAREVIDSMVVKGSFPPLMLAPVNFDAIYEQSKLAKERGEAPVN